MRMFTFECTWCDGQTSDCHDEALLSFMATLLIARYSVSVTTLG